MANPEHLEILKQGPKAWHSWRNKHPTIIPDLSMGNLEKADLHDTDLRAANLRKANLRVADLTLTDLRGADLQEADLKRADLRVADLEGANLSGAILEWVNFGGANLTNTMFINAHLADTVFEGVDLSSVIGLNRCIHFARSCLDHSTLSMSGPLPLEFLRGCGLSDKYIDYIPSLFHENVIQFHSCFISYSTKDQEFADRLYNDLQENEVRSYYAPEEMKGGEKLYDQIDNAIRVHDKLLLALSENSLNSEWVRTEIRRCRKAEQIEGTRKLFPLRIVDMTTIQDWKCFDADFGKDLAAEVREYFIPDFSNWKDHDSYKKAFERLLRDLKKSGRKKI